MSHFHPRSYEKQRSPPTDSDQIKGQFATGLKTKSNKVMRGPCLQESDRLPKMLRRLGCSFLIACLTSLLFQYCLCVRFVLFFWLTVLSEGFCVCASIVLHLIASDNPLYLRASSWYGRGLKQNNRKRHEIR